MPAAYPDFRGLPATITPGRKQHYPRIKHRPAEHWRAASRLGLLKETPGACARQPYAVRMTPLWRFRMNEGFGRPVRPRMRCINKATAWRSTMGSNATRSKQCRLPMTIRFHPSRFPAMIRLRIRIPRPTKTRCQTITRLGRTPNPRADMPASVAQSPPLALSRGCRNVVACTALSPPPCPAMTAVAGKRSTHCWPYA